MKKYFLFLMPIFLVFLVFLAVLIIKKPTFISPLSSLKPKVNYRFYSFDYLSQRDYFPSEIKLEEILEENEDYVSYLFSFSADGRRITGMANLPRKEGKLPVAILIRGWVDEKIYQTGMGTEKMADFLAKNGFLTLAPDLLGYGGSDSAFPDMLQTRFFRPITIITLIESVSSLSQADSDRIVIWAHSNGGQIALSVLEITGASIPTSLWAPVSIDFPDSVLYFADEMEDRGKLIRKIVEDFEKEYDFSDYSITNYFNQIKAPLIVHQGTADESVPLEWTEKFVKKMRDLNKEVIYYQYSNENHNFHYGNAPTARSRDLEFFKSQLNRLDNN